MKWTKDYVNNEEWSDKYREGFDRLKSLSRQPNAKTDQNRFREFDFDIVMANPPFAGDLTNKEQLKQYLLGRKNGSKTEKLQNKVGRDILFIERNIDFLKPGGRMAVVLPQGRFNNANEKYIRNYILERCRLLGVVGLHTHVFKPHTSTKTSVLFVQKWTDENDESIPISVLNQKKMRAVKLITLSFLRQCKNQVKTALVIKYMFLKTMLHGPSMIMK